MHHPPTPRSGANRRMRIATAITLGVLAAASVSPARADVKASFNCRKTLSSGLASLALTGFKAADSCHKGKDKICTPGSNRGDCNDVTTPAFDPKTKYATAKTKTGSKIDGKCLAGDPVLTNYAGGNIETATYPLIDEAVEGNSNIVQGDNDIPCDQKNQIKCLDTIGKSRTKVVSEVVKNSVKCQQGLDKSAITFGAISPTCLDTAMKSGPKATDAITKSCTGVDPNLIGTCSPLPACVVNNAVTAGQNIAKDIFSANPATPVCGNGTLESPEQCDDANTTSGDGCSSTCEIEGRTCTDLSFGQTRIGTRTYKATINTPTSLAGLQVDFDYPQFQSGIPGTGTSSIVTNTLTTLQPVSLSGINDHDTDATVVLVKSGGGIVTGDLFSVALDNCSALSQRICNRNQEVTNCCNNPADPAQFQIPAGSEKCPKKACTGNAGTKTCFNGLNNGAACTSDGDCPKTCLGGTNNNNACTVDSECPNGTCSGSCQAKICVADADCSGTPGDCQSVVCGPNNPIGAVACIGGGTDALPQYGLCVFKCDGNPPACGIGHFGVKKCAAGTNAGTACTVDSQCPGSVCNPTIGDCDNVVGACPGDNVCVDQITSHTCNVSSPVDADGQHVAGVTCTVTVTEGP